MRELGLRFSGSSREVLGNEIVGHGALEIRQIGQKFAVVSATCVLRSGLDSRGSTLGMIEFRIAEARKVWFRHRAQLQPKAIPVGERMQRSRPESVVRLGHVGAVQDGETSVGDL